MLFRALWYQGLAVIVVPVPYTTVDGAFREPSIARRSFSCVEHKKGPLKFIVLLSCTMPIIATLCVGTPYQVVVAADALPESEVDQQTSAAVAAAAVAKTGQGDRRRDEYR